MIRYRLSFGDEEPGYVADHTEAQQWMMSTIKDLGASGHLHGWRALGLIEQVKNMPLAGTSFTVPEVGLVKVEKERV